MARPTDTAEERRRRRAERRADRKAQRNGHKDATAKQKKEKGAFREWFDSLAFAIIVMVIIRTLFVDLFQIPTPSMERNLLVGDYLFVSKMHYGIRTPMSVGLPLTPIHLPGVEIPYTRIPGFGEVERGDAMVFNYPDERGIISRKTHYIKRVIGLPGETLALRDKLVYVDGEPVPLGEDMQQWWTVYKKDPRVRLSRAMMEEVGVDTLAASGDPRVVRVVATPVAAEALAEWSYVDRVEPMVLPRPVPFPEGKSYTQDNFGPVHIPAQGQTVELTDATWREYQDVIGRYEGHEVERVGRDEFLLDGEAVTSYTFEQDYFFVMGDNRDNSQDSRYWGFVPMDHVVGKAVMIYFSWDRERNLPRVTRMLNIVDQAGLEQ